ncbi:MAG: RdgB/HAM1 family non-canonical purine NTP pyrophosphatase [Oscillospiraceae bacterium]|nr:RdgB/HAM1 family non-canonical purine NTP pyrophosphatase [Oscillospiraceae bacterium]
MKLIIASNNKGKIREFKKILEPMGYEVLSQRESGIDVQPEENGTTFEENAAIKARAIYAVSKSATLADDSGIVIDALGGQPGVYSARYGTPDLDDEGRTALVLKNMQGVPDEERTARYVAVIHFIDENGNEISVRGTCEGRIGHEPVGENGFGYDPIFIYGDKTFAQHTEEFKNSVSHRANALKALAERLSEISEGK